MKFKIKVSILSCCLLLSLSQSAISQNSDKGWFHIPGFTPEIPITLTNEQTFYGVMGAAALSYALSEFVFKDKENMNFYQVRTGMNNEHVWGLKNVWLQNFGVENRVAPWFGFAAEFNLQQWNDQTPNINSKNKFGMGFGIMTYYRWYLFGKKRISPYLEYGTGLFYGFKDFPYNGSNFTFNHSTQLGIEYTMKNNNKIRLGYGQFHQSNNGLAALNPGYDANGFSISYSWFWKTSKW
jgi:hypothetical protein